MKKVIMSFLASAVALMSCSKVDTPSPSATQEISVSATPATIILYISENYPDATISSVLKYSNSDTTYAVTLNTFEFLAFGTNEKPIGESMADTTSCDSIHDSIGGGHHHGGGHHGGGHGDGNYGDEHHGGAHHGGIPADSIPAAITEYVDANFAGYTVHNAMYDTLCPYGIVISVMINASDSLHHKLFFDASGLFLAMAHRIKSTELPASVTSTITANYAAYTLREKAEQLILADNSMQYIVYMHKDTLRLSVILKEDGTVVCEQ